MRGMFLLLLSHVNPRAQVISLAHKNKSLRYLSCLSKQFLYTSNIGRRYCSFESYKGLYMPITGLLKVGLGCIFRNETSKLSILAYSIPHGQDSFGPPKMIHLENYIIHSCFDFLIPRPLFPGKSDPLVSYGYTQFQKSTGRLC